MTARKKRVYMVVMLLGGAALVVDRLVGTGGVAGPASASASGVAAPVPLNAESSPPIPELTFPGAVEPMAPDAVIADIFAPPDLTKKTDGGVEGADNGAVGTPAPPGDGRLSADRFQVEHFLNGLVVDKRLKIANVDGRWLALGSSMDGCRLITISTREAVFECYDGDAVLALHGCHSAANAKVQSRAGR